jgi:hypothetical protein
MGSALRRDERMSDSPFNSTTGQSIDQDYGKERSPHRVTLAPHSDAGDPDVKTGSVHRDYAVTVSRLSAAEAEIVDLRSRLAAAEARAERAEAALRNVELLTENRVQTADLLRGQIRQVARAALTPSDTPAQPQEERTE